MQKKSEGKIKPSFKKFIKTEYLLNLPFSDCEHFYYILILLTQSAITSLTENIKVFLIFDLLTII